MAVWGLVMAKARASFSMSDIFDNDQRKRKSNQIFYICIMLAICQLLKSCAENDYAERFINNIESKLDQKVFHVNNSETNSTVSGSHHRGPTVQS